MIHDADIHAIVLRAVNYRESDRILTLLSPEIGKVTATARGGRKTGSKLLAASQPFICGRFFLKKQFGQWQVSQCDIEESFYDLRLDYDRLTAAGFLVNTASRFTLQEQEKALYETVYRTLAHLSYGNAHPADVLLWGEMSILEQLGYRLHLHSCVNCDKPYIAGITKAGWTIAFVPLRGGILCANCGNHDNDGLRLLPGELEALQRLQTLPVEREAMESLDMTLTRRAVSRAILLAFEHFTDVPIIGQEKWIES